MLTHLLTIVGMVVSGLVAGVFFDVALAMMPAFLAMRPGRYVEANNLIGKGYHPTMPIVVNVGTIADLALVFLTDSAAARVLFGSAAALLIGTQFVSQLGNVPINRRMSATDPDDIPPDWDDPRRRWRAWHLLRTAFAMLAVLANGIGVITG